MARRALLVGVNNYENPRFDDLRGCVNDVTNMRHILITFWGLTPDDIRVITDHRATRAAISERLKWLTADASAEDYLFFHFSGHGSQIRERDDEDELADHRDELICPHDLNWDDRKSYITDDDLNKLFGSLPDGVQLEVVMDCCHSGTNLRDFSPPAEALEPEKAFRFLPPPLDIAARFEGLEDLPSRGFRSPKRSTRDHILWAACRDFEKSADAKIEGSWNGAFTYYFCKHVRESGGTLSRRALLERVRASLSFNRFAQTPQLETEATVRDGDFGPPSDDET